jgi:hypothetical protein
MATTLNPIITGTPGNPLTYNVGMAETFSWIPVENNADRPLFAQAVYLVNSGSSNLGTKGMHWVTSGTSVGPYQAILATTTQTNESHATIASLTAVDGSIVTNGGAGIRVLAGTYIYNVKAFTITDAKTGVIAYH